MREMVSDPLPGNLEIKNYHSFARGYLKFRNKMPERGAIYKDTEKASCIRNAINTLQSEHPDESTLMRPSEFFREEITFIQRFGYSDFNEYMAAERVGRGNTNLTRKNRKWIYSVYKEYIRLRREAGRLYDYDDIAFYTYVELLNDTSPRLYSHIIIDEGQDFSPMMIKSLVHATAEHGSFTFFGDVAQQIYGSRLSWRDSGIDTRKIWRLDVNYRNPGTITAFAKDITQCQYWKSDSDMINPVDPIAEGPKPVLFEFASTSNEIEWIVKNAIMTGENASTVVLCRTRRDVAIFAKAFSKNKCDCTIIHKNTSDIRLRNHVYITTYHTAKGLEFNTVFLPFLSADRLPDPDMLRNTVSEEDACSDELKLFYVAVTRSRFALYMSFTKQLSHLFPEESINYVLLSEDDI